MNHVQNKPKQVKIKKAKTKNKQTNKQTNKEQNALDS